MKKIKIHLVCAARPNFMKIAPVYHELKKHNWCEPFIVHTGQHYDFNMSDAFFADLNLPEPHFHLGIKAGSHAVQTGNTMIAYEELALSQKPDWLIVVGDVNATIACTLTAKKMGIMVAHLEAGLRSFDRDMPEELNRILTDSISDVLWTPSPDGDEHLLKENISKDKISRIGNIMLDSFEMLKTKIMAANVKAKYNLNKGEYAIITMHRPSNVDNKEIFSQIIKQLETLSKTTTLVWPLHPRSRKMATEFGLLSQIENNKNIIITEPLGYADFISLVSDCKIVVTDSGGIQEETTYLGIPCVTVRENTERPITITNGSNMLANSSNMLQIIEKALSKTYKPSNIEFWDGKTAVRLANDLKKRCGL